MVVPRSLSAEQAIATASLMGLSAADLRREAAELGIDDSVFIGAPGATLTARDFGRLFISLIRRSQLAAGVDVEALDDVLALSSYRLLYLYLIHGDTLASCLQRAAGYFTRFEESRRSFKLAENEAQVRWEFDLGVLKPGEQPGPQDFSMEQLRWLPGLPGRMLALYLWHRTASWLIGNFIDLGSVHFDCEPYGSANDYVAAFGAPVYFNADWCGMTFHPRYLDAPNVQNERAVQSMLATFPAELIEVDELASSATARVRGLLGTDFSVEMPSLEQVAERLFTTTATLHRRLREEGTSFQKLKDGCRRDAAITMLRGGEKSGAAIADVLGFSDPSTFYRAFKKWTGMTPQEFKSRGA